MCVCVCIGALQYTTLIFGFSSLHTLRQYEEEGYATLYVSRMYLESDAIT